MDHPSIHFPSIHKEKVDWVLYAAEVGGAEWEYKGNFSNNIHTEIRTRSLHLEIQYWRNDRFVIKAWPYFQGRYQHDRIPDLPGEMDLHQIKSTLRENLLTPELIARFDIHTIAILTLITQP